MSLINLLIAKLRNLVRAEQEDVDFDHELESHLKLSEERYIREGLDPDEARRRARRDLGGVAQLREAGREARGLARLDSLRLDVRLGLRMLRRSWGLTLVGGLAMAVAIGIATTMFMYFDVFWNSSVPLEDGDSVVSIQIWDSSDSRRRETSLADFQQWSESIRTLDDVGAFRTVERVLEAADGSIEPIQVAELTPSGLRIARVDPLLGRPILDDDARPDRQRVALLGYDLWQARFAADPAVVGTTLDLDGTVHTVIGVMPEHFGFPVNHNIWTALDPESGGYLPAPFLGGAFGRLAPGVSIEQAEGEFGGIGLVPSTIPADSEVRRQIRILPYVQNFIADVSPEEMGRRGVIQWIVVLLVSLLLIPPCINVAVLVYARTVSRQEEVAVRTALGASRSRIVVQLLIEMLMLSTGAALTALVGIRVMSLYLEQFMLQRLTRLPFWVDLSFSASTLTFALGLAVSAALIAGLIPAMQSTGRLVRPGLQALASRTRIQLGLSWKLLVVTQVALSFAVLPVAAETIWGTLGPYIEGPGIPVAEYLTARVAPAASIGEPADSIDFGSRLDDLVTELEAASPGSRITLSSALLSGGGAWAELEGADHEDFSLVMRIDDHFLETMGTEVLAGRAFDTDDFGTASNAVLVNRTFADRMLGGANPVGTRVRYHLGGRVADSSTPEPWYEIVGVVSDVPANPNFGTIYRPSEYGEFSPAVLIQHVPGDSAGARRALGAAAGNQTLGLAVDEIEGLQQIYTANAVGNYLAAFVLVVAITSVLLLSSAGIYALMAFTVSQRRREIGIRAALGANSGRLLAGVLGRACVLVGAGGMIGTILASALSYYIPAEAFGGWEIPGILPLAAAVMLGISALAVAGPARRALNVGPSEALNEG